MKSLMPLLIIIVSVGMFFFFIDPRYKEIKLLQQEISENEKTLTLATQLREKRDELRKKYNNFSPEERTKLEKLLPDTVDNVRLIIDINNIAEKYGVIIQNISINSEEKDSKNNTKVIPSEFEKISGNSSIEYADTSKVGVISFSFSVVTQYDVFLQLLKALEESLRIVDIRDITISKDKDGVFYNYRVNLDTYWLK